MPCNWVKNMEHEDDSDTNYIHPTNEQDETQGQFLNEVNWLKFRFLSPTPEATARL